MQKYFLGLDIGTNSCGWAITDEKYNLLRKKGKDLWGVRLFDEAQTAAERRQKRTNRRRLDRQKLKLSWLKEIFANEINKVDKDFFTRLKYSNLWMDDKQSRNIKSKDSLFFGEVDGKKYTDKDYYKDFPTIYHLRKSLTQKPAEDVRFLFLAIHNIIKRRGHFLFSGQFGDNINVLDLINQCLTKLKEFNIENNDFNLNEIDEETCDSLIKILSDKKGVKYSKSEFCKLFDANSKKEKAFAQVVVDGKLSLKQLFDKELENDKIEFDSEDIEDKIQSLNSIINEDEFYILCLIKDIFSILQLKIILGQNEYICDAMVQRYDIHHKQLEDFKKFIKRYYPKNYFALFRDSRDKNNDGNVGYPQYVNCNLINGKKQVVNLNVTSGDRVNFYKYIKKILSQDPENLLDVDKFEKERNEILSLIENNEFLLKQRSKANTVFPNKLYEKEIKKILQINASKFDFLNKVEDDSGFTNAEKILQILDFRIPYFVGPISSKVEKSSNIWSKKEAELDFKPWTIEKIVDFDKAEDNFIGKMTNKCSYLKDKEVLPKQSIIYSKFRVLNEVNKITINGSEISVELKQKIFTDLFMQFSKVTVSMLKKYLVAQGLFSQNQIQDIEIGGIDKEFTNQFSSYVVFINSLMFSSDFIEKNLNIIEKVIKYHTIISDKNRLEARVKKEFKDIFSEQQIKFIKGLNFKDWGRLSKEFLVDLKFVNLQTGEITCILDEMWNTNQNLQQIIYNTNYTLAQTLIKQSEKSLQNLVYDDVASLYCSPAVKRGVWQTLKIIKELVSIMGYMPEKIFVEVTRQDGVKGEAGKKSSRKNSIEKLYKSKSFKNNVYLTASEIAGLLEQLNKQEVDDLRSEKLYLYFMQCGKCAYSGESINILDIYNDNLYDVDHIIPQSIIKDDSINNKVLVKSELNRIKDNNPVPIEIINKQKAFWKILYENKLMSKEKFDRLIRVERYSDEELGNFIARQLVETNQTVKAVIDCLKEYVDNPRKIVYSKATFVTEFRNRFGLIKCRSLNDLHHAQDAFLNIIVGNVLFNRFTDDPRNFYKSNINNKVSRNIKKIFDGVVYSSATKQEVWNLNEDIARIKKTYFKSSPIISVMNYSEMNGAFYKETIHKSKKNNAKTQASVSLKGDSSNPLNNFEKYGGYNNLNNAYFMLIESNDKKGNVIKTLEALPILILRQFVDKPDFENNILNYLANKNNLIKPKILIDKINFKSTLQVGGGEYLLGGKTGNNYVLHNANQLLIDEKFIQYLKVLEKYQKCIVEKIDHALQQNQDKIVISKAGKEGNRELVLTKTENILFYDYLIQKLNRPVYKELHLSKILQPKLINKKPVFDNLSVQAQAKLLINIVKRMSNGAELADLSALGEGSSVGSITINKNITNKNIYLIKRSITGLFEKRIKL